MRVPWPCAECLRRLRTISITWRMRLCCRAFQLLTLSIAFVLAFCGYVHYAQLANVGGRTQATGSGYVLPLTPSSIYTGK